MPCLPPHLAPQRASPFRAGHVPGDARAARRADFAIIPSRLKPALPPVSSWLPHFDRIGHRRERDLLPLPRGERDGVRGLGPIGESRTPSPPPSPLRGEGAA